VLLAIIIREDFLTVPFMILACDFLVFGATEKTQTKAHIPYLGLGMRYQSLVLYALLTLLCAFSLRTHTNGMGVRKKIEMSTHTK
jgi:hypothetical protein